MKPPQGIRLIPLCVLVMLGSSGCLMHRTVTEGGQTVSQKYVVTRPIRDAVQNQDN